MLTPTFELSQTDVFLIIQIKAPFAKVSDTEIDIDTDEFKFYSKPYYLRLTLPGEIVQDGRETCKYDADTGYFTMKIAKVHEGETFTGLDMLTLLLAPKGKTAIKQPLIEVLASETESEVCDDEIDWFIEQHPYQEPELSLDAPKYGFANQRSGVFERLQEELLDIVDVKTPDKISITERHVQRLEQEQHKFNDDHYLADLFEDDAIQEVMLYKSPWFSEWEKLQCGANTEEIVHFTTEEKEKMRKLPRKEYLIDDSVSSAVYLGLVDIIFAYAYNLRVTEGETNVESSWTINKISSTLSCLEVFTTLQEVITACVRRSLCFPLYRNWQLSMAIIKDVHEIFSVGKKRLLKSLLEIHDILQGSDMGYILNDLYITDYCVWIQSASDKKIDSLAAALGKVHIEKDDVGFHLLELEQAALSTLDENENDEPPKMMSVEKLMESLNLNECSSELTDTKPVVKDISNLECAADDTDNHKNTESDDGSTDSDDGSTDSDDGSTNSDDECADPCENIDSNNISGGNSENYVLQSLEKNDKSISSLTELVAEMCVPQIEEKSTTELNVTDLKNNVTIDTEGS